VKSKETYNLVHLLVCLYIFDNARYRNQKIIIRFVFIISFDLLFRRNIFGETTVDRRTLGYYTLGVGRQSKQSLYKRGQAQRVPEGRGTQISRQPAHEGGKVVIPRHRPLLPPREICLVLMSIVVRGGAVG
jgi:hypothetical protein